MDPALDFDEDETQGVSGVAPGQSLEDAIAAYEARLAAEEAEADATDVAGRPRRRGRGRHRRAGGRDPAVRGVEPVEARSSRSPRP